MPIARHLFAFACFLSLALTPVAAQAFSTTNKITITNQSDQVIFVEVKGSQRKIPPHATWTYENSLPAYFLEKRDYAMELVLRDGHGREGNAIIIVSNMFTAVPTVETCQCGPGENDFGNVTYTTRARREGAACNVQVFIHSR